MFPLPMPRLRVFKLENSDATEVTGIITQIIQGLGRSGMFGTRGNREPFSFSPDARSNSLIVFASTNYFKVVEQLIKTLDQSPEKADREVKFYSLTNANAFDVAFKLDTMFSERTGENKVVSDVDSVSNTLTIFAQEKRFYRNRRHHKPDGCQRAGYQSDSSLGHCFLHAGGADGYDVE